MAASQAEVEIAIARIKADVERSRIIAGTVKWVSTLICGSFVAYVFFDALVKLSAKPAWLELCLAVLAAASAPTLVSWRLLVRVRGRVGQWWKQQAAPQTPSSESAPSPEAEQ